MLKRVSLTISVLLFILLHRARRLGFVSFECHSAKDTPSMVRVNILNPYLKIVYRANVDVKIRPSCPLLVTSFGPFFCYLHWISKMKFRPVSDFTTMHSGMVSLSQNLVFYIDFCF